MFAVMGLRQMFFVLEHMHERFQYVKYGVAVILMFTGVKMLLDIFDIHIHNLISIAVILILLIASIIASVIVSSRTKTEDMADKLEKKKEIEEAFEELDKES
jgi:tellurite resistance protein TerC